MEGLIFLLLICNTNLVFSDDNAAIESGVGYQVHALPEENGPENDQRAESSQIISHSYEQSMSGANLKGAQSIRQPQEVSETAKYSDKAHLNRNGDIRYTYEVQNARQQPEHQAVQYLQEGIRHKPIVVSEGGVHPVSSQNYSPQEQQIRVQKSPTRHAQIYNSQPPLSQHFENEHTTGYQTYVEHILQAEDDEIQSALKENSIGDIKRLVPKSGISFKIYHKEKSPSLKLTEHKLETLPGVSTIDTQATEKEFLNSVLHHRVKVQAPVQQLQVQTSQTHLQSELSKPQQIYEQQNIEEHHSFGNQLPVENAVHQEQNLKTQVYYTQQVSSPRPVVFTQSEINSPRPVAYTQTEVSSPRPVAYTQPEISAPKPILEITGKGIADPPYKIKLRDEHVRATSTSEFNKNIASAEHKQDNKHLRYQQSIKTLKQVIPENFRYQKELTEGVHADGLGSFTLHEGTDTYASTLKGSTNYVTHQETSQDQFLHSKTFADSKSGQPILNRLSGTYVNENIKPGPSISHLAASGYTESLHKNTQSDFGNVYVDNEAGKAHLSSVDYTTQFDGKSSPNNFDHQKALEGSTSFDIKNAIGNTEGAEVHTGYVTGTEIHPTEELQKQQLVYSLPSLPTVLVENNILKAPVEGQHIKTIDQVTSIPQFTTHSQESVGKFYRQPQFIWTSEDLKQGNELHQPLIKLHFPKEEIQYVKTPKVEVPAVITHQHQLLVGHQNGPYKLHGFQFQHKKHPQNFQTNLKFSHPVIVDWSLFKSKYPNVNINSLIAKPELVSYLQEPTKKIIPILVRKRKNRSNNKEMGVVYGKITSRGPAKPNQRQEKTVHVNLLPSASNDVKLYEAKDDRKKEFSVSASYKVDRSYKSNS